MKQKLALCCALVHRPEILFLDEPTTGVDAVSRREFWDLLATLKATGLTIVVSTPYMDEADRCDRVALIQRGRLLAIDTPRRDRASRSTARCSRVRAADRYRALLALREYPHAHTRLSVRRVAALHRRARATRRRRRSPRELRAFLAAQRLRRRSRSSRSPPTVEDSFMARMGAPARRDRRARHELTSSRSTAHDLTRTLRRVHRRRPHHLRRARRRGVRLPRRERRRKDDGDPDADRPAGAERAARRRVAGHDVYTRERSDQAQHRLHEPALLALRGPHRRARTSGSTAASTA